MGENLWYMQNIFTQSCYLTIPMKHCKKQKKCLEKIVMVLEYIMSQEMCIIFLLKIVLLLQDKWFEFFTILKRQKLRLVKLTESFHSFLPLNLQTKYMGSIGCRTC